MSAPKHFLSELELEGWEEVFEFWTRLPEGELKVDFFTALVRLRTTTQDAQFDLRVRCEEEAEKRLLFQSN